jgi:hypothetical protein
MSSVSGIATTTPVYSPKVSNISVVNEPSNLAYNTETPVYGPATSQESPNLFKGLVHVAKGFVTEPLNLIEKIADKPGEAAVAIGAAGALTALAVLASGPIAIAAAGILTGVGVVSLVVGGAKAFRSIGEAAEGFQQNDGAKFNEGMEHLGQAGFDIGASIGGIRTLGSFRDLQAIKTATDFRGIPNNFQSIYQSYRNALPNADFNSFKNTVKLSYGINYGGNGYYNFSNIQNAQTKDEHS